MAESVARVKILARVEGLEGFDKLKGAFKGLQQAIGPTDQQLAKARQDIIAFGEAGKKTEQVIRGQIDALRALKTQAGTGGQLYTTLGADIRRLEGDVRDLNAAYVNLATGASFTAKQLASLTPATRQPGMLDAQIRGMRENLERFKLLSKEYIQGIADINRATQEGARNQQSNNLFSNALNANPYLQQNTYFFDAPKAFEKQALSGGLPATVAGKQQEISLLKEQLQNVLRDASTLEPLLNDIRRIENNLASARGPAVTGGGVRSTIPGLEGAGREMSTDWQKARITLGQLTTEYERLKQAQQEQVHVLRNQLIEAEDELQRMLNGTTKEQEQAIRADERRARVQEKLAQIQQDTIKAPGVGGYRDDNGVMLARGSEGAAAARANLLAQVAMPPREISSLYRSIGDVGYSRISNDIERMGNSFAQVAQHIRMAQAASDGSVNSLQSLRGSWAALRNTVSENTREFRQATRELQKLDRQLEKTEIGGLRGKVGYIGQGVGAIASAGIFGGAEGAVGGALGGAIGALGGPAGFAAGSFIGSSVGAYAGMGRQQLGQFTTYAADIQKAEIALKGITKTQVEYQRALAASASVTRDFNVPQLEATKGMTQLSAAVIGAGGKVADAEVVFRNVTAAIKASGGTSEDVSGALTALGQIFSKGKVSAEELQGQLGERLPGAVTMFAKATGRTLPQLQKDLEQGVVGLNDLMKFVTSDQGLGQFDQRAKNIAKSSAEAGARLTVTFNDTKKAIGDALLPLGSQIQDSLAKALREATPALIGLARGIGEFIKLLVDNAGVIGSTIAAVGKFALVFSGATLAVRAFGAVVASLGTILGIGSQGLALLGSAFGATSAQAVVAQNRLIAFGGTVKTLAKAFAAPLVITVAIVGAQLVIDYFNRIKAAKDRLVKTVSEATGGEWLKDIGGTALDKTRLTKAISDVGKAYEQAADKANKLRKMRDQLKKDAPFQLGGNAIRAAAQLKEVEVQLKLAEAQEKLLESRYKAGIARLPNAPAAANPGTGLTDFSTAGTKGDLDRAALDKIKREQDQAAADRQRLAEAIAQGDIRLAEQVFQAQVDFDRKRFDLQQELIDKERQLRVAALTGAAADAASSTAQFFRQIDELRRRSVEAAQAVQQAGLKAANTQYMQSVTAGGAASTGRSSAGRIIEYLTGDRGSPNYRADHGGSNYHEHLAFATAQEMRKAMEALKAAGIKIGSTTGGRHAPGSYHYSGQAFDVPASQVPVGQEQALSRKVREVLAAAGFSGQGIGGAGGRAAAASQQRRNVTDQADTAIAQLDVETATKYKTLLEEMVQKRLPQEVQLFALEGAKAYNDQTQALKDNVAELTLRQQLEASATRPEIIDAEIKKAQLTRDYNREIEELKYQLTTKAALEDPTKTEGINARIRVTTQAYNDQKAAIDDLTRSQIALNDAQRFGQDNRIGLGLKEGVQQYVESIGTMREASSQLAQDGIKGIENALFELATTGSTNFRQFAADILRQTARMIIQQMVLGTIMRAIGFGGGGGGSFLPGVSFNPSAFSMPSLLNAKGNVFDQSGLVPFAKGGIVTRPTMFPFAKGGSFKTGIMGEAGPEAIVPLRRGRDGRLGVGSSGVGSPVNVNVSVDAKGTSVQGDQGRGEQLGRAISQAVQEELIRQKRPGGLLAA